MKIHQSVNKIIVTELNPMSDVPQVSQITNEDVNVLVFVNSYESPQRIAFGLFRKEWPDWAINGIGWIPMPVYDPSAKSPADRYEKLRKLNPRQFDELYARNLRGENFDKMVDNLK